MLLNTLSTIICMTENQVKDIRLMYKENLQKKIIKLPKIYTLNGWLKKEYEDFCMIGSINESHIILNGIEEKLLWEKIIKKDLKDKKFQKKQIENIIEKVISADRYIREYRINKRELKEYEFTEEGRKFNKWLNQFTIHCNQKKLLTRLNHIEFFIENQIKHNIVSNQKLTLVGFDNKSPIYEKLFNVLIENNVVTDYKSKQEEIKLLQEIVCEDVEDEIREITKWIKKNTKKKLLIISPALNKYQIKLQNELDRKIQPDIYKEYNASNVYNSNLQRPLSKEPIINAAINLLRLNSSNQTNVKIIYESLIFNNWIDVEGYNHREQLANYINDKKIPKFSISSIIKLIKNDSQVKDLKLDSLINILSLIKKNQTLWVKKKGILEWITLTEQYWKEIKIFNINKLLMFEVNNINSLDKSLNQIKNNQIIDHSITFEEYWEILFMQLSNWPAPPDTDNSYIDINGFDENPIKKYDAIWVMNMNTSFCPGKTEFNPFISKKIQKKYHIFDDVYQKKIINVRLNRLKNFSADITISYSQKDGETKLFKTPGYFDDFEFLKTKKSSTKPKINLTNDLEEIEDHKAPAIVGSEISVTGGFRSLENYQVCPAWAFYENRLHANSFKEDAQDEISKMARGKIIHELLENFWKQYKNSNNLANMSEKNLKKIIDKLTNKVLSSYKLKNPYLTFTQIQLENNYLKNVLYGWLSYEKTNRTKFSVIQSEKKYIVNIDRITFNVKVDRIDEYEDGTRLLIDYKTGSEEALSKWIKSPIKSLQMPVYTIFTGIKNISAAGIGYICNENVKLVGLSSYAQDPLDAKLKNCSLSKKNEEQWQYLINSWHEDIHKLASGYLSGDASTKFKKESDLDYCSVKPLLRLAERRFLLEQTNE